MSRSLGTGLRTPRVARQAVLSPVGGHGCPLEPPCAVLACGRRGNEPATALSPSDHQGRLHGRSPALIARHVVRIAPLVLGVLRVDADRPRHGQLAVRDFLGGQLVRRLAALDPTARGPRANRTRSGPGPPAQVPDAGHQVEPEVLAQGGIASLGGLEVVDGTEGGQRRVRPAVPEQQLPASLLQAERSASVAFRKPSRCALSRSYRSKS